MTIARLFAWALVSLLGAVAASPASAADYGIVPGSLEFKVLDQAGDTDLRAGSHPDRLVLGYELSVLDTGTSARDTIIDLSPGLTGNPDAVPACSRQLYDGGFVESTGCPDESQVGVADVLFGGGVPVQVPVFSVEPAPGEAAMLTLGRGAKFPLHLSLRPGDYGLTVEQREQTQTFPMLHANIELWGIPADHQVGTAIPRRPFLTLPTRCDGVPFALTFRTRSWLDTTTWLGASADTGAGFSDCQALPFDPKLELALDEPSVDRPSGARVELQIPQDEDPDGRASSQLRDAEITLPNGVTISPAAADGRVPCTDAQFGLASSADIACPFLSKVGSIEIETPALSKPLAGGIFLGEERPGDRFRILVAAAGFGTVTKFSGSLQPDTTSGQLTVNLKDLPEIQTSRFAMRFGGGPRALLTTPLQCGPITAVGTLSPYSGTAPVKVSGSASIGAGPSGPGCAGPPPFSPGFTAGSTSTTAGGDTSLSMTLRRRDGEQLADRFSVTLPKGLVATMGSTARCADPAAGCPAGSRVGSVVAEVGSGSEPVPLRGDAYLTGSYRRAPFGLALIFDAKLGPFDLGTLTVRAALRVDSDTGQISVETDSIPKIVEGIPVRFQTLGLDIDRPGFVRNPTSCAKQSVAATVRSASGSLSSTETPFAVTGCAALRFKPKISISLGKQGKLRRGSRPPLRIDLGMPGRGSGLRSMRIELPDWLAFDSSSLRSICARQAALDDACPSSSAIGTILAHSPMSGEPLSGPIYVAQPADKGQPDLWMALEGSGIRMSLRSAVEQRDGLMTTTTANLPDVPLADLRMRFAGGTKGALELRRNPCGHSGPHSLAVATLEAQNGERRPRRVEVVPRSQCRNAANASHRPGRSR